MPDASDGDQPLLVGCTGPRSSQPNSVLRHTRVESQVAGHSAQNTLQVSAAVYCQTGATAAACASQPEGTLVPPALSGTIATRESGPVVVDEPNTAPYSGGGFLTPLVPGTSNVEASQPSTQH